jgi:hypothetical protein
MYHLSSFVVASTTRSCSILLVRTQLYFYNCTLLPTSTHIYCSYLQRFQMRPITSSMRHNAKHRKEPHAKYNPQDLEHDPSTKTDKHEAFDFSDLDSDILKSIERMTHKLSELRAGGRLNPTILEGLSVNLEKSSTDRVKIKDIAQVVSKGQYIHIILSDEEVCRTDT